MSTEYNRGYHDCIHLVRVMLRQASQKRVPLRASELMEAFQYAMSDDVDDMYRNGQNSALAQVRELLGPNFLPLYPGDIHEILQRLVINPQSS